MILTDGNNNVVIMFLSLQHISRARRAVPQTGEHFTFTSPAQRFEIKIYFTKISQHDETVKQVLFSSHCQQHPTSL